MTDKIAYITGVKGFCAIAVTVLHYFIAFGDFGFIGWQSGVEESQKIAHYWAHFPFSLIANGNFFLYIFFALIAFIPAIRFFTNQDETWIKKQVIIRYFRFLPYTLILTIFSYFLYTYGLYLYNTLGDVLQIPWNKAMLDGNITFWDAMLSAFLRVFVMNDGTYISAFWCLHIIFIGSYLTYALLLFFGTLSCRLWCYTFFLILSFYGSFYSAFIFGIMAADIYLRYKDKNFPRLSIHVFILGLLCASFGELILFNANIKLFLQNFGVFLIVLAICFSKHLQYFFEHPVLLWCGRYSFELILVHLPIMFTLSAWIFLELYALVGYFIALLITLFASIFLNITGMLLFEKIASPLSKKLSSFVYAFITK